MLFPLKIIFFLALMSSSVPIWCTDAKSLLISKADVEEASRTREHTEKQMEIHTPEALSKALEAKEFVQKVVKEARDNNNTSPCLSGNNTEHKGCAVVKPQAYALTSKTTLGDASTQLIVFVSFSMPDESLKALFKAVENNPKVRLVLQGLIDDSMEKTAQKIHAIEGVVDIDPELFEKYHIERVPTFLWVKQGEPLAKLSGNITLTYAQEVFRTKLYSESSPS